MLLVSPPATYAAPDSSTPVLNSFSIGDNTVGPGETVSIAYSASDDSGSLHNLIFQYTDPLGGQRQIRRDGNVPLTGTVTQVIPADWPNGTYQLGFVTIYDANDLGATLQRSGSVSKSPSGASGPTSHALNFSSLDLNPTPAPATVDTAAPEVVAFDFTPKSLDISTGAKTLTITARITDASGAEPPTVIVASDTTTQTAGFGQMTRISGTATDGVYQRTVTIPDSAAPGTWSVRLYPLTDTVGNSGSFTTHPTKLTVTNGTADGAPTAPSSPQSPRAKPGNASVQVSWIAPVDDGGSPVSSYTVTAVPGGRSVTVTGSATTVRVSGLVNGARYLFSVVAFNEAGPSSPSNTSAYVTPAGTPARPAAPQLRAVGRTLVVTWRAPSSNGAPISKFKVTISGVGVRVVPGGTRKVSISNLKPGRYTARVTAINRVGSSPASAPSTIRIRV